MVIIRYHYPTKSTTLRGSLTSQVMSLLPMVTGSSPLRATGGLQIINFRARGISRGTRKLTRTFMLIKKKKVHLSSVSHKFKLLND
jgi:hypothetical protein